jgi:tripartite-type tricarboxylate transporter receptor subunit TctC
MTTLATPLGRRPFLQGLTGAAALGLLAARARDALAQDYPAENFSVVIPTGQGGGAERLARSFDAAWTKTLGRHFAYEFFPGAGGQVGYELFINQREPNGYNLLFGNMGPEMIMYALQKPNYKFPDDYIYFCRVDVDDSCVFVRADSEFASIEQVVDAAKQRTLNVGTSRIPHPASIGILALGDATGGKFNLVPYGGGNPTYIGVLNAEVEIGVLPVAGVIARGDQFRVLAMFNRSQNLFASYTNDAPLVNAVFGTDIPDLYSSRSWAIHTAFADQNPEAMALLEDSARKVFDDPTFKEAYLESGAPIEALSYGDRQTCTDYALAMVELSEQYREVLSAAE